MVHYGAEIGGSTPDNPFAQELSREAYYDTSAGFVYLEIIIDEITGSRSNTWYDSPSEGAVIPTPSNPQPLSAMPSQRLLLGSELVSLEATPLTPPLETNLTEMEVKGGAIIWRTDGQAPTAQASFTTGIYGRIELESADEISGFRWASLDSSASLYVEHFYNNNNDNN